MLVERTSPKITKTNTKMKLHNILTSVKSLLVEVVNHNFNQPEVIEEAEEEELQEVTGEQIKPIKTIEEGQVQIDLPVLRNSI